MAQTFPAIPQTQTIKDSRQPLLDRDEAAASSFSGAAFPTSGLLVGMRCHRTDLGKVYVLRDTTPTWVEVEDVSGTSGRAPQATKLATAQNFSIIGDGDAPVVSFDGTGNVVLSLTLDNTGVTAGTYTKVTVDAKGRVTGGAAIANGDLPADLSRSTLRATSASNATLGSADHGLGIGPASGVNLAIDGNQIQGRNNGAASAVRINFLGGNVVLGDGATTSITMNGLLNTGSQMIATVAEAQAATTNTKVSTPLRVKTYVDSILASQSEAQAGTDNTKLMTPLRVAQQVQPVTMSSNALTDVTGSRANGTTYQNTSGSWRVVITVNTNNGVSILGGPTAGTVTTVLASSNQANGATFALIPPGWYYRATGSVLSAWFES